MTGFNSKRDAAADKDALFEKFEVAQPAQKPDMLTIAYQSGFYDGKKAALAQPAQEPVAWAVHGCSKMWRGEFAEIDAKAEAKRIGGTCIAYALYTAPPKREWVGLTDKDGCAMPQAWWDGALWAEVKLKEKNNGT
jgi:hypothetical protein